MNKRFYTYHGLAFDRRASRASERTVLEAISLYENDPKPLTRVDAMRLEGLEEILRVHHSHGAELKRSHRRVRTRPRVRARRCLARRA